MTRVSLYGDYGPMKKLKLKIGDSITVQKTITLEDAAQKYGTGSLTQLLGTPSLVEMMIEACVQLIDPKLEEGFISVGKKTSVNHAKPTIMGETITLKVDIVEYKHHRLDLEMTAWDELGTIGTGTHSRTIVNDEWLMIKLRRQKNQLDNLNF